MSVPCARRNCPQKEVSVRHIGILITTLALAVWLLPDTDVQCSSFCFEGKDSHILAANYDDCDSSDGLLVVNKRGLEKSGFLPGTSDPSHGWTSRYGSITLSSAGRELPLYGMNEAGLAVSTVGLPASGDLALDQLHPPERSFWLQYLLDNFASVEEVIAGYLDVSPTNDRDHYLICDSTGNSAVIEFLEGRIVHFSGRSLPVKVLTDTEYAVCADHWAQHSRPEVDPRASVERFIKAAKVLEDRQAKRPKSDIAHALQILRRVSQGGCTRWSMVFDTRNQKIHFRTKDLPDRRYVDLTTFDFSCGTAMKMLDVNSALKGDVSAEFEEYSSKVNLEYMDRAFKHFGMEGTRWQVEETLEFFESFKCTAGDSAGWAITYQPDTTS
jgi:penicillin V acylase-like amidase (Ntn superfamily)